MAAVLSPSHLHPGLIRLPGAVRRRPVAPRLAGPVCPPSVPAAPTAATYRRRQAVALLLLVAVSFVAHLGLSTTLLAVVRVGTPAAAASPAAGHAAVGAPAPVVLPAGATTPSVYVVRSGDTLWSIAHRLQPDTDPRPLVDALAERAGSSALRPGQRIDLDGLGL